MRPLATTTTAYTLHAGDMTTLQAIATSATAGVWVQRRDDCDGTGGVGEPRPPRPAAPSGAVALRLDA